MKQIKVPKKYLDACTGKLMRKPVKAADGFFYDFRFIHEWFIDHDTSPKTYEQIDKTDFVNKKLQIEISSYIDNLTYKENLSTPKNFFNVMITGNGYHDLVYLDAYLKLSSDEGQTALHFAATHGQYEIIKYILENTDSDTCKTLLNAHDDEGNTPLHNACLSNNAELIELLLKFGANINYQNMYGETPLIYSVQSKRENMVTCLIKNKADLELKNQKGESALMISVCDGNKSMANLLLNKGANPSTLNKKNQTVLHHAIKHDLRGIITETAAHIGIDSIDKYGDTPLHIAARFSCKEMTSLLLDLGADVTIKNKAGQSAIDIASEDVANLIKSKMDESKTKLSKQEVPQQSKTPLKDKIVQLQNLTEHQQSQIRHLQTDLNIAKQQLSESSVKRFFIGLFHSSHASTREVELQNIPTGNLQGSNCVLDPASAGKEKDKISGHPHKRQ